MSSPRSIKQGLDEWLSSFEQGFIEVDFSGAGRRVMDASAAAPSPAGCQHQLTLMLRGRGVCTFRRERLELGPGTAVWVQPGAAPQWRWLRRTEMLHVAFTLRLEGQAPRLTPDWLYAAEAWALREKIEPILDELALPMPQSQRRTKWLLGLAVTDVMRLHFRRTQAGGLAANQRSRVVRHVSQAGVRPVHVGDLAELLELSEDHFARRFRRTFGESPRAWLMRQRMLAAGRMLRDTGATVTQAATATGYTDVSQFSRQFRRTLGISPSRYRRA